MLVCNVSLRPPRAGIAADILEAIEATDATATGQLVLATLVDDPANVGDITDAYLGEIMVEAANAAATLTAGSVFGGAMDETVTAADTQDATLVGAVPPRDAMLPGVFVNSDGTLRESYVDGVMVNL